MDFSVLPTINFKTPTSLPASSEAASWFHGSSRSSSRTAPEGAGFEKELRSFAVAQKDSEFHPPAFETTVSGQNPSRELPASETETLRGDLPEVVAMPENGLVAAWLLQVLGSAAGSALRCTSADVGAGQGDGTLGDPNAGAPAGPAGAEAAKALAAADEGVSAADWKAPVRMDLARGQAEAGSDVALKVVGPAAEARLGATVEAGDGRALAGQWRAQLGSLVFAGEAEEGASGLRVEREVNLQSETRLRMRTMERIGPAGAEAAKALAAADEGVSAADWKAPVRMDLARGQAEAGLDAAVKAVGSAADGRPGQGPEAGDGRAVAGQWRAQLGSLVFAGDVDQGTSGARAEREMHLRPETQNRAKVEAPRPLVSGLQSGAELAKPLGVADEGMPASSAETLARVPSPRGQAEAGSDAALKVVGPAAEARLGATVEASDGRALVGRAGAELAKPLVVADEGMPASSAEAPVRMDLARGQAEVGSDAEVKAVGSTVDGRPGATVEADDGRAPVQPAADPVKVEGPEGKDPAPQGRIGAEDPHEATNVDQRPTRLSEGGPERISAASGSGKDKEMPDATLRDSLFDQIVKRAVVKFKNERSEIKIDLKPEFLGNVRMQILTENQQVSVRILAESPVVRDMLEGGLQQLKTELNQQGLQVERLEVSVSEDLNKQPRRRAPFEANRGQTAAGTGSAGGRALDQEPPEAVYYRPRSASRAAIDMFA
jgi:hypothetical protein